MVQNLTKHRGIRLLEKGRLEDALSVFRGELSSKPTYVSHYGYATTLYRRHQAQGTVTQGIMDEVISSYLSCLSKQPDFADAHLTLGVVYRHKASLLLEKLQDDPDHDVEDEIIDLMHRAETHLRRATKLDTTLRDCSLMELETLRELKSAHPLRYLMITYHPN